jgi:hypothetical protein
MNMKNLKTFWARKIISFIVIITVVLIGLQTLKANEIKSDVLALFSGAGVFTYSGNELTWKKMNEETADLLSVGDVDGDGLSDLVMVRSNQLVVLKANQLIAEPIATDFSTIQALAVGDKNSDTKDDIFISDAIGVYCRDAVSGVWTQIIDSPARLLACGDMDGDSIQDIIGCYDVGIWYQCSTDQSWKLIRVAASDLPTLNQMIAADLSGDGIAEFIGSFSIGLYSFNPANTTWKRHLANPVSVLSAGDMDGDGLKDLVMVLPSENGIKYQSSITTEFVGIHTDSPQFMSCGNFPGSAFELDFPVIEKLPYIGGSLMYDGSNLNLSHLLIGTRVPVLFVKYEMVAVPSEDSPETTTDMELNKIAELTRYGVLSVTDVDAQHIDFSITAYGDSGNDLGKTDYQLQLGESLDVTLDGVADLAYQSVIGQRVVRGETAFLTFLTSENDLTSSLYSYAPDLIQTLNRAGGNVGFNNNGNGIWRSDLMGNATRSSQGADSLQLTNRELLSARNLQTGDYLVDVSGENGGTYLAVTNVDYSSGVMNLSRVATREDGLDDISTKVMQFFCWRLPDNPTPEPAPEMPEMSTPYRGGADYDDYINTRNYCYNEYNSLEKKWTVVDKSFTKSITANGEAVGTVGIQKVFLGAGYSVDVDWGFCKVKVRTKALALAEFMAGLEVTKPFSFEEKLWSYPFNLSIPIIGGGAVLNLDLGGEVGINYGASATDKGSIGVGMISMKGSRDYFSAGFFYLHHNTEEKYDIDKKYLGWNFDTNECLEVFVKPYVTVYAKITLLKMAYAKLQATLFLKPTLTLCLDNNYNIDGNFKLDAGADVDLILGISIHSFLFDYDTCKTFHLWEWQKTLLQYDLFDIPTNKRPDLKIAEVILNPATPSSLSTFTVSLTLENAGNCSTPKTIPIGTLLTINGQNYAFPDALNLHSGEKRTIECPNALKVPGGAMTLTAWVDHTNQILESNNDNNKTDKTYPVSDYIKITNPVSGAQINFGDTVNIRWQTDLNKSVGIYLYQNGKWICDIACTLPAQNLSYSWKVGNYAGNNYQIRIACLNLAVEDSSDSFTIKSPYTITAGAAAGGTISPSGAVPAPVNGSLTFTVSANACYDILNVVVDGVSKGAISSFTFNAIAANHTINASFKAKPAFTVTASAGTGGAISPVGAQSVCQNNTITFTITANAGYTISNVTVDGVSQGKITSFTFSNVTANHSIAAAFVSAPTLTVTAPNGGESLVSSSAAFIKWSSANIASSELIKVEYTLNGSSWVSLGNFSNSGSVPWTVPSTLTTTAKVRVTAVSNTAISDSSNAAFSIIAPAPVTYTVIVDIVTGHGYADPGGLYKKFTVNAGDSKTFKLYADPGYEGAHVQITDLGRINFPANGTITLSNIQKNMSVGVAFVAK